jgi:RNA polymerase sigma-70 factor (ECF subfamily)
MTTLTEDMAEDLLLIQKARAGDERAFTRLVRKYEQTVYGFAFKVCRKKDRAAETLQDTFVNVYRKLDQFDGRSKFSTWLYSIVANNCLMKHRRRKLDAEAVSIDAEISDHENLADHIGAWTDSPITRVMNRELKEHLDRAIQKLPVEYRVVFILRDVEGQSAAEAAKILHLSIPAVKSRLRRARIFLRNQLDSYMRK